MKPVLNPELDRKITAIRNQADADEAVLIQRGVAAIEAAEDMEAIRQAAVTVVKHRGDVAEQMADVMVNSWPHMPRRFRQAIKTRLKSVLARQKAHIRRDEMEIRKTVEFSIEQLEGMAGAFADEFSEIFGTA